MKNLWALPFFMLVGCDDTSPKVVAPFCEVVVDSDGRYFDRWHPHGAADHVIYIVGLDDKAAAEANCKADLKPLDLSENVVETLK